MSIVGAIFWRSGDVVIQKFTDHLGNNYSQTCFAGNLTDQQLQDRLDVEVAGLEARLAEEEIERLLGEG